MNPNQYILIVGCTGVGKSVIAEFLHQHFASSHFFSDPYIDNPFITHAYNDTENKSFQSEIFFIKEFLKIHKAINNIDHQWIFQERSIYECVHVFCRLFLLQSKIDKNEYQLCVELLNEISYDLRLPDKIIYLTADPTIIIERIITRGRPFERSINIDFLKTQQKLYEEWLYQHMSKYRIPIIKIDNGKLDAVTTKEIILKSL